MEAITIGVRNGGGIMAKLGEYLRDLRTRRGLTQEQVEEGSGVAQTTLSAIESRRVERTSDENMRKLAEFYDVPRWTLYAAAGLIEDDRPSPPGADTLTTLNAMIRESPGLLADLEALEREENPEVARELLRELVEAWRSNLRMNRNVARVVRTAQSTAGAQGD